MRRWGVVGLLGVFLLMVGLWMWPQVRDRFFPQDKVWEHIQRTGRWRVGMDPSFPPFEMVEGGQIVGLDADLARAIADQWGVQVDLVGVGFDGLIDAVRTGRVDAAISAIPYDPLLTRDVRFSRPYFDAGWRVVVLPDSAIHTLADLAGKKVAVEWGSEGDMWARRLRRKYPGLTLVLKPSLDEALRALLDGEVDAAVVDGVTALQHAHRVREILPPLSHEGYVVVVPYRAPLLHRAVDEALLRLEQEGVLKALVERWVKGEDR